MMNAVVMDLRDNKKAVALDANGRFRLIANDNYHIGQIVQVRKISRFVRPSDYKKMNLTLVCVGAVTIAASIVAIINSSNKN